MKLKEVYVICVLMPGQATAVELARLSGLDAAKRMTEKFGQIYPGAVVTMELRKAPEGKDGKV